MGSKNIPKDKLAIIKKDKLPSKKVDQLRDIATDVVIKTNRAIETGTNKPNASNGKPMKDLKGAAKYTAILKNIGREMNEDGGMVDGINTIALNKGATSTVQTIDIIENNQTSKKAIKSIKGNDK